MDSREMIRLINDYPVILYFILFALGAAVSGIPLAFKLGASRERHKIDAEKLAKAEDSIRIEKDAHDKERARAEFLESEIAKLKETRVVDGLVFLVHEEKPRNPICPSCYGKGNRTPLTAIRMQWGATSYRCPDRINCKFGVELSEKEIERLQNMDF